MRRVRDAVALGELRCNGGGHGGCQAGCSSPGKRRGLNPSTDPKPARRRRRFEHRGLRSSPVARRRRASRDTPVN